ncbi:hypothetical protein P170DRAFT_464439 [Aspergillus steynii IBT 23096]|uniref:Uncharacterized protein n=1 Tax=Aspergillus steynii IBT 23096 TaxID=1392250 RepID=A0A2I2G7J7_9EURO|nr:uncharacterized protein P170DRAFT_464439 [Aspergillus steynii IBT 23096]PLB48857.1 hypothetical protein P170DRAFT_464439 [Aspergillus steynii IBT 23096]
MEARLRDGLWKEKHAEAGRMIVPGAGNGDGGGTSFSRRSTFPVGRMKLTVLIGDVHVHVRFASFARMGQSPSFSEELASAQSPRRVILLHPVSAPGLFETVSGLLKLFSGYLSGATGRVHGHGMACQNKISFSIGNHGGRRWEKNEQKIPRDVSGPCLACVCVCVCVSACLNLPAWPDGLESDDSLPGPLNLHQHGEKSACVVAQKPHATFSGERIILPSWD